MGKLHARICRELILYVKQMAWLAATPKPPEGTKRAKHAGSQRSISRIERMKRGGIKPALPPTSMPHIASRLMEIGPTQAAGMGVAPLSWGEINAWCTRTHIEIPAWEARLIRRLSVEYIAFGRLVEAETCPPPFHAGVTRREIETEAAVLDAVLG